MHTFDLTWGLPHNGRTCRRAVLRPLTIGGELAAIAEIDELPPLADDAAASAQTERGVRETLIYWSHQISIEGVPPDVLTADYLMDNLVSEDYKQILGEMAILVKKSTAASDGHAPDETAAQAETGA
ncbi:hypothetical protein [Bergeriella denitrificans]|uniref:Uncharacterized protein n=1 Tax=Bergeriella denitrificans TaxID=494 RepID=A0A378UFT2_BERDE|nr:hypothetical protein [Bergeriella denitrificans]STZ75569.1 Uncharacterised protein [Bergeriella denitrificans]